MPATAGAGAPGVPAAPPSLVSSVAGVKEEGGVVDHGSGILRLV